ncbi:hypothetical protein LCGC14_2283850 [marine sediment metagenome]|uniref:ATP-grasp domain-containing protein n=1 Tax=marine sediment metagenome TaxID=412755 RepID=A0A0F9FNG8_9ZZZZ
MFIAGTIRGDTAINLAFHLKNCEGGYNIPEDVNFLVNYGHGILSSADLNGRIVSNKLTQLQIFRRYGLRTPDFYDIDWNRSRSYTYPLVARKYHHARGTEAIFIKTRGSWRKRTRRVNTRHYFVEYIPKETEFRVHVLGNDAVGISTKSAFEDRPHPHIWSRDRGWQQIDYNGRHSETLRDLGIKACRALGYDFGAVDIMLGRDGLFYLLEVNSAPRLNRRRRVLYCDYFRRKYNEKFPRRNGRR